MKILIPALLFLLLPGLALARPAQSNQFGNTAVRRPAPPYHQIQASAVITVPYEFNPIEIDPNPPGKVALPIDTGSFYDVDFVNGVISISLGTVGLTIGTAEFAGIVLFAVAFLCLFFMVYLSTGLVSPKSEPAYQSPNLPDDGRRPINTSYEQDTLANNDPPAQPSRARAFGSFFRSQYSGFRRSGYRSDISRFRGGRRGGNPFK